MRLKARLQLSILAGAAALAGLVVAGAAASRADPPGEGPRYDDQGRMQFPAGYRTWVYLSTGLDMSYTERPDPQTHMFDSVFVNRGAYEAFQRTGTWPDRTVMVLEARRAAQKGSINRQGFFQAERMAAEVHVKDEARFRDTGGWAFFGFNGEGPGRKLPVQAGCQACHEAHGAVDQTFVQFYPTLLPVAEAKKTLSAAYLKAQDEAGN